MSNIINSFIITSIIFCLNLNSQSLITIENKNTILLEEYNSISNSKVSENLFYAPYVEKKNNKKNIFNLLKNLNYKNYFVCEPVLAIRNSTDGFNMYSNSTLSHSSVTWVTPGIKISSTIPLLTTYSNLWIYSWSHFYKHSAYGFNDQGTYIDNIFPLFNYNSDYSVNYYQMSQKPSNGIDFDEGQGGMSLLSPNVQLIFGKFQTSIGPFYKGNLSVSKNSPSFPQFILKANYKKKIYFSYLLGSLKSNISTSYGDYSIDVSDLYIDEWLLNEDENHIYTWYNDYISSINNVSNSNNVFQRYIINHRLDFIFKDNIRLGIYEQIIFGAKSPPLSYLIPLNPLWSSQHSGNDLDNLQIGIDWDYYLKGYRIYGAMMIDEWAPFDTFSDNERNWFAYQIGFSRILNISDKRALMKIEYALIDPRAYTHRFIINQPKHNGYNLGYWSENNSDDIYSNLTVFINDNSMIKFEYQYTRFGDRTNRITILEKQYINEEIIFLGDDYNFIKSLSFEYCMKLDNAINLDFKFSNYITDLFEDERTNFTDLTISVRYNIEY